jgi:hypothetical protein
VWAIFGTIKRIFIAQLPTPVRPVWCQGEKFSFQEFEMDWRECKVFWNPYTGFIRVADQHDPHPSKSSYPMWLAGREAETAGLAWDDHRVVAKVFVEFSSIVVRDEIPARKAHKAFLMIRQYAEFIAPDA